MTSEEGLPESDVHKLNKRAGWGGKVTAICKYINCGCGEERLVVCVQGGSGITDLGWSLQALSGKERVNICISKKAAEKAHSCRG